MAVRGGTGITVSAAPCRLSISADRALTATNPLYDLTSATVPTSRDRRVNASQVIESVHDLQQMAESVVAYPMPCRPQPGREVAPVHRLPVGY
jgi:hypothetical protein